MSKANSAEVDCAQCGHPKSEHDHLPSLGYWYCAMCDDGNANHAPVCGDPRFGRGAA